MTAKNKVKYYVVSLLCLVLAFSAFSTLRTPHEFHVSTTKVEYTSATKVVKFSSKISTEYLETIFDIKASEPSFLNAADKYIKKHITVTINGIPKEITFSGCQPLASAMWIYFEIPNVENVKTIELKNTILLDKFTDQQNVVNFNIDEQRKTLICKLGTEVGKVAF